MKFKELLSKTRANQPLWTPPHKLLCLDPGETIGWAVFIDADLSDCGQWKAKDNPQQAAIQLFGQVDPTNVVCEDYRIYAHKTNDHTWSALFTPQLIGAIKMVCELNTIPIHMQMAATAKGFCTPAKLKEWGMYIEGMRHADDAIKHGCYHLLFHDRRG